MQSEPIGNKFEADDIYELTCTHTGFRLIITGLAIDTRTPSFMEVFFPEVRGFRYLDEGDLRAYCEGDIVETDHCIFKIIEGGWLHQEAPGILSVTKEDEDYTEYFVATGDNCVSILASGSPNIRIYDDPFPLT